MRAPKKKGKNARTQHNEAKSKKRQRAQHAGGGRAAACDGRAQRTDSPVVRRHLLGRVARVAAVLDDETLALRDGVATDAAQQLGRLAAEHRAENQRNRAAVAGALQWRRVARRLQTKNKERSLGIKTLTVCLCCCELWFGWRRAAILQTTDTIIAIDKTNTQPFGNRLARQLANGW